MVTGSPRRARNRRRRTREGPEPGVCEHPLHPVWHTQGEEGESTSCRGTVQSARQRPQVRRKGGRAGLSVRESGRHVVRGRQSSPVLEVRPGNRQGWWERSKFREQGRRAHPGQDRRLPGVATHSRLQQATSAWSRVGIRATWLRGRYRLGHRPVVLLRTETARCTVSLT